MEKIKIVKCTDPNVKPVCPACNNAMDYLLSIPLSGGWFNESNAVVCPHCHVMLGYGKVNYM